MGLKKTWTNFRVPPPSEGAKEKAKFRAMAAFRGVRDTLEKPASASSFFLRPLFLGAAAVLIAVGVMVIWRTHQPAMINDAVVLEQMQELFGPALSAVVEKNGVVEVVTDSKRQTASVQPVVIEVQQGKNRLRILGFSGRELRIPLKGSSLRVDPLITAAGDIILVGEDFVIDESSPRRNGATFRTHQLNVTL